MVRSYYAVNNYRKGFRNRNPGDSERHRLHALGISTGRKSRSQYTPSDILALQQAAIIGQEIRREEEYLPQYGEQFAEEPLTDVVSEEPQTLVESEELSNEAVPGQDVGSRFMPSVQASPAAPQLYARKQFKFRF